MVHPYLKQWRWRCTFRDAYYVCLLIWPFAHTKLPKINKILDHYYTLRKNNMWLIYEITTKGVLNK